MSIHRRTAFFILCGAALLFSGCASTPESIATKEMMADYKLSNSYGMFGHVARQGKYSLNDASPQLTVSQAVLRAGGFSAIADKHHVVLRRGTGKLEQRLLINVDAIMRKKDANETDPVVKAGDVIIVYGSGRDVLEFLMLEMRSQ